MSYLIEKLELKPETADVVALGKLRDKRAVQPLIALLTNENERLRQWTCHSLGSIGDTTAVESLKKTWMTDSNSVVRSLALVALARLGYKDSIPALIWTLESGWSSTWEDLDARHSRLKPVDEELGKIVGKRYKHGLNMPWEEAQKKAGTETLWKWWEENKDSFGKDRS